MDRYELELKDALQRREPASGFTSRVLAAVERESAAGPAEPAAAFVRPRRGWQAHGWRWAAVGALAASLSFGFVIEKRRDDRRAAEAQAEAASVQIYDALLLAGSKIHHAREAVRGPLTGVAESPGGIGQ